MLAAPPFGWFHWTTEPESWVAFATLLAMEIVLGIDNVVFISIIADKLPANQQQRARTLGLALAMVTRIALLFSVSWIIHLTAPLFSLFGHTVSGRDLLLLLGGLFLLGKSTLEIHHKLEAGETEGGSTPIATSFTGVIIQILLLDVVFSFDSVITAVGMVDEITIMVAAVVLATIVMMVFAAVISSFVQRHPTFKMLALGFLLLVGVALIAEGLHQHVPKGYIYFAMAFAVFIELLNMRMRSKPVTRSVNGYQPVSGKMKKRPGRR
jgi:predicted tellurium resistance membrane protein TerC